MPVPAAGAGRAPAPAPTSPPTPTHPPSHPPTEPLRTSVTTYIEMFIGSEITAATHLAPLESATKDKANVTLVACEAPDFNCTASVSLARKERCCQSTPTPNTEKVHPASPTSAVRLRFPLARRSFRRETAECLGAASSDEVVSKGGVESEPPWPLPARHHPTHLAHPATDGPTPPPPHVKTGANTGAKRRHEPLVHSRMRHGTRGALGRRPARGRCSTKRSCRSSGSWACCHQQRRRFVAICACVQMCAGRVHAPGGCVGCSRPGKPADSSSF